MEEYLCSIASVTTLSIIILPALLVFCSASKLRALRTPGRSRPLSVLPVQASKRPTATAARRPSEPATRKVATATRAVSTATPQAASSTNSTTTAMLPTSKTATRPKLADAQALLLKKMAARERVDDSAEKLAARIDEALKRLAARRRAKGASGDSHTFPIASVYPKQKSSGLKSIISEIARSVPKHKYDDEPEIPKSLRSRIVNRDEMLEMIDVLKEIDKPYEMLDYEFLDDIVKYLKKTPDATATFTDMLQLTDLALELGSTSDTTSHIEPADRASLILEMTQSMTERVVVPPAKATPKGGGAKPQKPPPAAAAAAAADPPPPASSPPPSYLMTRFPGAD